jgi:hypothetical protein
MVRNKKDKDKVHVDPASGNNLTPSNGDSKQPNPLVLQDCSRGNVERYAFGFEFVILLNHVMAIYLTQTTIYRARPHLLPEWFGPATLCSSAILAKYIVCRCIPKAEFLMIQSAISNRNFSELASRLSNTKTIIRMMVPIALISLFCEGIFQMSYYLNYRTYFMWFLPAIVSVVVFDSYVPPIPDMMTLWGSNSSKGGTQNTEQREVHPLMTGGLLSSDFASLCLAYIAFRVGEGIFLTSVLPIILIEDHYMVFDSTTCSLIAGYVATSTTILLSASTLFLNRVQLVQECGVVGYWICKGNAIDFNNVNEWTSEYSFKTSPSSSLTSSLQPLAATESTVGAGAGGGGMAGDSVVVIGYPKGSLVSYKESVWEACGSGVSRCLPNDYMAYLSYLILSQEVGDLNRSKIFFGCSVAYLCLLFIQIIIVLLKLVWIPFALLMMGSLSGMVTYQYFIYLTYLTINAYICLHT